MIIARRELREVHTNHVIAVGLYQPINDPKSENGDWVCRVEVSRNGVGVPVEPGYGVDALQALVNALIGLRKSVAGWSNDLIWLDEPGRTGLPLVIEDRPDFISLVEKLVEVESTRRLMFNKALHAVKAKGEK